MASLVRSRLRASLPASPALSRCIFAPVQRRSITIEGLDSTKRGRERVLILGSGWSGFTLAQRLDASKYQPVVVSPRSYFVFTPLLASTSVGTLEFRTALEPVRRKRRGKGSEVEYVQGWADRVDFAQRTVEVEEAVEDPRIGLAMTGEGKRTEEEVKDEKRKGKVFKLEWDKLVVSVGCYVETFGTPGVREHALFLKDVGDARKIRNRLLACFEMAALPTTTDEMRKELLNFAIVGGGPTGIEFSAELHDIISEDLSRVYPELVPFTNITVYDVAPQVLSMFDAELGKYAMKTFRREGINIRTEHHVECLRRGPPSGSEDVRNGDGVYTLKVKEVGEIGVGMVVWSTGLMMNPFVKRALTEVQPLPKEGVEVRNVEAKDTQDITWRVKKHPKIGSVITDEHMRVMLEGERKAKGAGEGEGGTSDEPPRAILNDVFALGDCASIEGTMYPATAQVASQKAEWLAKRLNKGDIGQTAFHWRNMGVMAYLGNWNAILQGAGRGISGRTAFLIWRGAYLTKSVSWRNKILIPTYWFINWVFGRDMSRF
ncbi:hypothetical protein EJ06DRAFT_542173 [Trichodelitschia bisporula]|uniref:Uncharacterized protein n=1 Tax=Trichodelitschia bisporula TaxID=703511 RepID=A0A6G1I2H8_9PEZI|nr:hypothetical protein EJ06DRAFT_542173 [Trichodelitschia bisporula]